MYSFFIIRLNPLIKPSNRKIQRRSVPKKKITSPISHFELKPVQIESTQKETIKTALNNSREVSIAVEKNKINHQPEPANPTKKEAENINKPKDDILSPSQNRQLNAERRSITHEFSINNHTGTITVGLYEDGKPGEIFIYVNKENNPVTSLLVNFSASISCALQYGVPLKDLVARFVDTQFEPNGTTLNKQIPYSKSIIDYTFRWLAVKFLTNEDLLEIGLKPTNNKIMGLDLSQKELEI